MSRQRSNVSTCFFPSFCWRGAPALTIFFKASCKVLTSNLAGFVGFSPLASLGGPLWFNCRSRKSASEKRGKWKSGETNPSTTGSKILPSTSPDVWCCFFLGGGKSSNRSDWGNLGGNFRLRKSWRFCIGWWFGITQPSSKSPNLIRLFQLNPQNVHIFIPLGLLKVLWKNKGIFPRNQPTEPPMMSQCLTFPCPRPSHLPGQIWRKPNNLNIPPV